MKEHFRKISTAVSNIAGSAWAFSLAFLIILAWAWSGPIFDYSDTWQLVINTGTTIVTFLMVFLIQSTQNRDSRAMQLKLDELLRATRARDTFIDIEDISDDELERLAKEFSRINETSGSETLSKFNKMLQDTLTKRHKIPGKDVANQVVNMLNPFHEGSPDSKDHKDNKKPKK